MKNLIFILSLSITLFSCLPSNDNLSEEDIKYLEQLKPHPLTEKEKNYISKLGKTGFNKVELIGPYYPEDRHYEVNLNSEIYYDWSMEDSLSNLASKIAIELYSGVLEDSVIVGIREIVVHIHLKSKKTRLNHIELRQRIPIRWLKKKLGFEVNKLGEDYYYRKYIDTSKIDENEFDTRIYYVVEEL